MDISLIIERICRFPVDFYAGKMTLGQLVLKSEILDALPLLTTQNVKAHLSAHPELIDQWLDWSADKRVSSGWYFTFNHGKYRVGFYPGIEFSEFDDPELACAEFINREARYHVEYFGKKPDGTK